MPESNRKKAYELFAKLYQKNPELADEIGTIPDFADSDITDKDLEALVNITDYYFQSKNPKIKEAFRKMLNIGMEDKRAYCSPLEALKWLSEKYEFEKGGAYYRNDPLSDYTLPRLLRASWDFSEQKKWSNFEKVAKRLNSPELVSIYMRDKIRYIPDEGLTRETGNITSNPRTTFERRGGDCEDQAWFASYCLGKASYRTYVANPFRAHPIRGHSVCVFKDRNGLWYQLDNACSPPVYKDKGFKDLQGGSPTRSSIALR